MSTKSSSGDNRQGNSESFMEISPADFFYRNRDLAGFTNPTRALYSVIRELVENSLDACELYKILPKIYVRLSLEGNREGEETNVYGIRIMDNGSGVPPEYIPSAFGQILFGSKYRLRQVRGTFGLGGKMAILYGQITTHGSVHVRSSVGDDNIYGFNLRIDIQKNLPQVLRRRRYVNEQRWRGTIVEFSLEGNYLRAMPRVLEYLRQTAMINPYAEIVFIDPSGRLYRFEKITSDMPEPPRETLPHPHGCDVETLRRMISVTECANMTRFMINNFHRVGRKISKNFLRYAGISERKNPRELSSDEIVRVVHALKSYEAFLPPDGTCLSPLGENLLEVGMMKELNPEFVHVEQRRPSAYSGFPFIVEIGIAYGGNVPLTSGITLYRFANKIPLLYDEASDVTRKVMNEDINWRYYKVSPELPVALVLHICSTKIPYKTVGKEFIADRPEIEREIKVGIKSVARRLRSFISRKGSIEHEKKRIDLFSRYLPKVARFSTDLAGRKKVPDIEPLLKGMWRYGEEEA